MDKISESIIKKYWIPALCAIAFVGLSVFAIIIMDYQSSGEWNSVSDVLLSSPACYFWILWFGLVFFSANGFTKEYRNRLRQAKIRYSLVPDREIIRMVKKEMSYYYSKLLIPVFAGWPIPYLLLHYDGETGFSPIWFASQFVPLLVDLIIFIRLHRLFRSVR